MKFALFLCFTFLSAALLRAQDDAMPNIDEEMKKALSAKPKSAAEMKALREQADAASKKMMEESAKIDAAEKAQQQAMVDAALKAPGPVALPAWTPQVPQFTAAGPATRKVVDGEARTVVTGTSALSPEALCDAWDAFKKDHPNFSHERTGSDINGHADLFVTYRNPDDNTEVRMEADRKAGTKVTRVTISSPVVLGAKP